MILDDYEHSVSIYLRFAHDLEDFWFMSFFYMYVHVCVMRQCLISLSRLALYMAALEYTITYLLTYLLIKEDLVGVGQTWTWQN